MQQQLTFLVAGSMPPLLARYAFRGFAVVEAQSPLTVDEADRDAQQLYRRGNAATIERPVPSRILRQIARGRAMLACQPCSKPVVAGVHVLSVNGALHDRAHKYASSQVENLVGNGMVGGEGPLWAV